MESGDVVCHGNGLRPLCVLLIGQHDRFEHVLSATIQAWGYDVAILSPACVSWGSDVEGDILLYDLDESFRLSSLKTGKGGITSLYPTLIPDFLKNGDERWSQIRFTIALSSLSVSRTILEQIGAIAFLQKPFAMGVLKRYLCVLQRLLMEERLSEPSSLKSAEGQSRRILVVDDNPDVAEAIRQCLLYEPGYEVAVAYNGLEALEQCLNWSPHCIVTDLIMPWMNGYQVMHCLSGGGLRMMPAFVVMSALLQLEVPINRSYLKDKIVTYIHKPFQMDHLLTAIERVCPN